MVCAIVAVWHKPELTRPRPDWGREGRLRVPAALPCCISMVSFGPLHALGKGHRIDAVLICYLPPLPLSEAERFVPARVGRSAESDLVPRPGVGVERRARVTGP